MLSDIDRKRQQELGEKLSFMLQKMADEANDLMKVNPLWREAVELGGLFTVVIIPPTRSVLTVIIHRPNRESSGIVTRGVPGYPDGKVDIHANRDSSVGLRCVVGRHSDRDVNFRKTFNYANEETIETAVDMIRGYILDTYKLENKNIP